MRFRIYVLYYVMGAAEQRGRTPTGIKRSSKGFWVRVRPRALRWGPCGGRADQPPTPSPRGPSHPGWEARFLLQRPPTGSLPTVDYEFGWADRAGSPSAVCEDHRSLIERNYPKRGKQRAGH